MMINRMNIKKYHVLGIALLILALSIIAVQYDYLQQNYTKENIRVNNLSIQPSFDTSSLEHQINLMSFSNDPFSDTQWYIDNTGQYVNMSNVMKRNIDTTEGIDMEVLEAWNIMKDQKAAKKEVVIAVIDTGIDYQHPDLAENMWVNKVEVPEDGIDNDKNGYIDDIYGWDFYNDDNTICHYKYSDRYKRNLAYLKDNDNHGTHVAGIIAAIANNNMGIAGIASNINVKIMALKINGGAKGEGDINSAIEAIEYATMMGADICNLSWATDEYSEDLENVMKESNMLFVAAAGNTGDDNDKKPMYPANFDLDNLISVTFIDSDGKLTDYSNYGAKSVDLAAPGDDIYSTVVGGYDSMSGSSMAAPQVSAVAAMLYAYEDHLYAANVKDILVSNIKRLPGLDKNLVYGGIPNAYQAVMAASELKKDTKSPLLSFETLYDKAEMVVPVYVEDSGKSKVRVVKYIYGNKSKQDFRNGVNGTSVVNNKVNLSKAGIYTFYAADYAGNETVQAYEVMQDSTAPKISTTYTVASSYKSRTIFVNVNDDQSGVKRVEYMPGVMKAQDFLPADQGVVVDLNEGNGSFKVKKDGVYTIFATDHRGNTFVKPIIIKTVKATELKLGISKKTMNVGEYFTIRTYVQPTGSTDKITFTSSDESVIKISPIGKVTAMAQGEAYIIATTASGVTTKYLIKVEAT